MSTSIQNVNADVLSIHQTTHIASSLLSSQNAYSIHHLRVSDFTRMPTPNTSAEGANLDRPVSTPDVTSPIRSSECADRARFDPPSPPNSVLTQNTGKRTR